MANTFVISCPECDKQMKVAEDLIGKKIRCKECEAIFKVKKPKGAPVSASEPEQPAEAKKATAAEVNAAFDAEDDDGKNPYALAETDDGVARCPHCAKELESKESRICLHCGYDTVTRIKQDSRAVYEPTGQEVFKWLLPGIFCILGILVAIGICIFCIVKTRAWMIDGWFYDDETQKFNVKPGCFMFGNVMITLFICFALGRFAYKRLVVNNKPPEKHIEKDRGEDE